MTCGAPAAGGPGERQQAGSAFLTERNAEGDTVRDPSYTVIVPEYDEVVTPYQDTCPLDAIEHDRAPDHPVVHQPTRSALEQPGPADPASRPACA